MIEVELKYALPDPEGLLVQLLARGAAPGPDVVERDVYFAHPVRDFAQTDEAFRLRWDGERARCTYKGPLLDKISKSREELEFDLGSETDFETARQVLKRLGFREVRPVEKRRRTASVVIHERPVLVTIDEIAGLGLFAELEVTADHDTFEEARDHLLKAAETLGLTQPERKSYLRLLIEQDEAKGQA